MLTVMNELGPQVRLPSSDVHHFVDLWEGMTVLAEDPVCIVADIRLRVKNPRGIFKNIKNASIF